MLAVLTAILPVVAFLCQHGRDFTEKGRFPCRVGREIGLIRVLAVNTAKRCYFRSSCGFVMAAGSRASSSFSLVMRPCSSTRSYTLPPVSRASLATLVEAL